MESIRYKREFIKQEITVMNPHVVHYYFRVGKRQDETYRWSKWKNCWRKQWPGRRPLNIRIDEWSQWEQVTQLEVLIMLGSKAAKGPPKWRKKK